MLISVDTMNKLHDVQYEMLKQLIEVMEQLDITYYFVHGSLLGALRQNDFIIEDDDIDIAMFREDFLKLIDEGNRLLPEKYFLQSSQNDGFPLSFGKFRDSETTFRQPSLARYSCNQGIYIDIFPIDYCSGNRMILKSRSKLMNMRITSQMNSEFSISRAVVRAIARCVYPSIDETIALRDEFYSSIGNSNRVSIYGGKSSEFDMPIEWFGDGVRLRFRDIYVNCPSDYESYLRRIYGDDFINHNPADSRIYSNGIEVSADVIDFERSYVEYLTV